MFTNEVDIDIEFNLVMWGFFNRIKENQEKKQHTLGNGSM